MRTLICEFITGEQGQDIVEYALLCAFIGLAAVAAFDTMGRAMASTYRGWDSGTQALAPPPNPQ